jgi:hypothetical protein
MSETENAAAPKNDEMEEDDKCKSINLYIIINNRGLS